MADTATSTSPNPWRTFLVVAMGVFVAYLDVFIVNVAFPDISREFPDVGISGLSWVLNGYAIGFAALLVPAGRLADLIGRKRGFLLGMAVFTLASAACALAPNPAVLVATRVVQSAGAALVIPTSLALLLAAFPPERRAAAVGAWGGVAAISAALGPVAGGLLVEASWRWVFLVNLPIGLIAIVAGRRLLIESRDPARGRLPDPLGITFLATGVAALALAIVEGPSWGWASGRTIGVFVAAAVLLMGFARSCLGHPVPAVELSLLKSRPFAAANVVSLIFGAGFAAMLLALVLFTEGVWGYSAIQTGLAIAPGAVVAGIASVFVGRSAKRLPPREVTIVGCVIFALGIGWLLARLGNSPNYVMDMLPGQLLAGFGIGLVTPLMTVVAAASLPPARFATGGGILNVARQIGTVLGIAVLVAILGAAPALADFRVGWWLMIGIAGASMVAALPITRPAAAGP